MRWLAPWLDLSLRAKCLFLISCPAAATVAMVGASYLAGTETKAAAQQLNAGLRISNAIERLKVSGIETSAHMRGYLITSNERLASKARGSIAAFDSAWQNLSDLTRNDPMQRQRLAQLAALQRARVEHVFGDAARLRSGNLSRVQIVPAVNAAEAEWVELERILKSIEAANSAAIDASLVRINELQGRQNAISAICLWFGLAGGTALTLLFARGITSRIGKLERNIARLAAGGGLFPLPGADEIGGLNLALAVVERVLEQRHAVLKNAPHGIAEVDGSGRYRWFNQAYAGIAGLSEAYRPPTIQATLPARDRSRIQDAIRIMQRGGSAEMAVRMEPPGAPPTEAELTFIRTEGPPEAGVLPGCYVFLRQIAPLRKGDTALIQAKDAAVASNHAKTDFLAKISHDIRTPLNAILGAADLLSRTALTFDQSGYVHMFQRNCRRLVALINDFLDFSRIEAGAMWIEKTPVQIREVVNDAVATFREDAARKGLALRFDLDPRTPAWLIGDSLRIQQVLVNLLSNALKFTIAGRVDVRVKVEDVAGSDGPSLRYEVLDTGPGIAPEDQAKVFGKFVQLRNQTAGQHGAGLGLSICRDLVELMGGEIGVSSQEGGGSNFHFTLPLQAVGQPEPQPGLLPTASSAAGGKLDSPLPISGAAIRILVAEDTEDNRLLVEHYLRSEPVALRFAFTGQEALDVVQRGHRFDLILMDIDMPVLDGIRATLAILAWETAHGIPATPIVALSADAMSEAVRSSLDAGCVAHVAKPIECGTLLATIQRYATARGAPAANQGPTATIEVSEQVRALVPQYLASKLKQIEEAYDCLAARDFGPIRRFGHNLKGTGSGYGFPAIEEMGREIERAAAEADIDRIAQQLHALHKFASESGAAIADPVS